MKNTKKTFYLLLGFLFCSVYPHPVFAQTAESEKFYLQAIASLDAGNNQQGLEYLNRAIGLNPKSNDALYARAYLHFLEENYEQAISDLDLLILLTGEQNHTDEQLYIYRGQAYLYTENYEEAEQDLLKAITINPRSLDAYQTLCLLYTQLDWFDEAQDAIQKALEIGPQVAENYYYAAELALAMNDFAQAHQAINTALKFGKSPQEQTQYERLRIRIFYTQGQYPAVIHAYQQWQKNKAWVDLFEEDDFYTWGMAHYQQQEYLQAQFFFELPEDSQNPELLHALAMALYQNKTYKTALEQIRKAAALADPNNEQYAPLFYNFACIALKAKSLEEGRQQFLQALYLDPDLWSQTQKYPELLDNPAQALGININQPQTVRAITTGYRDRAEALFWQGDADNALEAIEQALNLDAEDSQIWLVKGTIEALKLLYDDALTSLEQSLRKPLNQDLERSFFTIALVYKSLEVWEKALDYLHQTIQKNNEEAVYYAERAEVYEALDQPKKAIEDIRKAISLSPNEEEYLTDWAYYALQAKNYDEALEACQRVLKQNPQNMSAYYLRGRVYDAQGKPQEALKAYTLVLQYYPDDQEIQELYQAAKLKSQKQ
ncbi:tetratricopeptide repeat protein [Eisenibacter elegans]|jgi:tetratricopeptide (TPR) repeat protein|uniref:tetratricopeptide repeat protein n=1 Tax=Eisenibacter elegans TaxID=997 RepID=UPI0004090119|nr:tetratricopeptide repeat protein [Eisenibacter elegans]